jgi:hypothetical protein
VPFGGGNWGCGGLEGGSVGGSGGGRRVGEGVGGGKSCESLFK